MTYEYGAYSSNQEVTFLGKKGKIVECDGNNFYTVEFEDGTKRTISRWQLVTLPVFEWQRERREENNAKIEMYQAKAQEAKEQKLFFRNQAKGVVAKINAKFEEWGARFKHDLNSEQAEEYRLLAAEQCDFEREATRFSNQEFGCLMSACSYAHDNHMWYS